MLEASEAGTEHLQRFRLSGFRCSYPPKLGGPPATCVHSWPKKSHNAVRCESECLKWQVDMLLQVYMYYHDLSWPINHVIYFTIHVYLYFQDLHQISVLCPTMRTLSHLSFEIACGPMDIYQQQGMPSSTDVVGRGYLNFHDLRMRPLACSYCIFVESWMVEHPLVKCLSMASLFLKPTNR